MANGERTHTAPASQSYKLLDAETGATDNGVWVDVSDQMEVAVHVTFSSTGTVELHGSCVDPKPTDATDGEIIGTVTADDLSLIVPVPRWLKAKVTANGGTINAYCVGRFPVR